MKKKRSIETDIEPQRVCNNHQKYMVVPHEDYKHATYDKDMQNIKTLLDFTKQPKVKLTKKDSESQEDKEESSDEDIDINSQDNSVNLTELDK